MALDPLIADIPFAQENPTQEPPQTNITYLPAPVAEPEPVSTEPEVAPGTPTLAEIREYNRVNDIVNPVLDLSAEEIANLATNDPDHFNLEQSLIQLQPHWDSELIRKSAEAYNLLERRGWKPPGDLGASKLPGMAVEAATSTASYFSSLFKGALGIPMAMAMEKIDELSGLPPSPGALKVRQGLQREIAETGAASESSVTGLAFQGAKAFDKLFGKNPELKTDQDKIDSLKAALIPHLAQQKIVVGEGPITQATQGGIVSELAQSGLPVRPEEVESKMMGDPFAFLAFGKGLQGVGALFGMAKPIVSAAAKLPGVRAIAPAVSAVAAKIPAVERIGGKVIELAGTVTRKTAPITAPAAIIAGAAAAGGAVLPSLGQLATAALVGGTLARGVSPLLRTVGRGIDVVRRAGAGLEAVGKQVAGKEAVTGAVTQGIRDVLQSLPAVAGHVGHGAALDIGLAALTSTTPEDTHVLQLGTIFGAAAALRKTGAWVVSGQRVAPRAWGSKGQVPTSNQLPALESMSNAAYSAASPAVRERVNAVRQFLKGVDANTDVFLADSTQVDARGVNTGIEKALIDSGFAPADAEFYARQGGFFDASVSVPGKPGETRRAIVLGSSDSAPHEAKHAFQDVIGEQANQVIDSVIRDAYADQWESIGQKYTEQLLGRKLGSKESWRDVVLEKSGDGDSAALLKSRIDAANKISAATGAQAMPADVVAISPELRRGQWREILTPGEKNAAADKYIAREIAAENFDAAFKNLGASLAEQTGVLPWLARIVSSTTEMLGGDSLRGRTSEVLGTPLKAGVIEAVTAQVRGRMAEVAGRPKPVVTPEIKAPTVATRPGAPIGTPEEEAKNTADVAAAAPEQPTGPEVDAQSPREILGTFSEAKAAGHGVKITRRTAPGTPAGAIEVSRGKRREQIETARGIPDDQKPLWEKNFTPVKTVVTKDGIQEQGWSPEVLAANAEKTAGFLADTNPALSPFEIDTARKTFTASGWKNLFDKVNIYAGNQAAGLTGKGTPLEIGRARDFGFFEPTGTREAVGTLTDAEANFINYLMGFPLPGKGPVLKRGGKAQYGEQLISEATEPGRAQPLVEPRTFGSKQAEQLGFAGEQLLEVNPLRAQIEQAGVNPPSLIEVWQNLNVRDIVKAEIAPELPAVRPVGVIARAGFSPKETRDELVRRRRSSSEDRSITQIRQDAEARLARGKEAYKEFTDRETKNYLKIGLPTKWGAEYWAKVAEKLVEDSHIDWFKLVGTEKAVDTANKIASGELTAADWKTNSVVEALLDIHKAIQSSKSWDYLPENEYTKKGWNIGDRQAMINQLSGRWGPEIAEKGLGLKHPDVKDKPKRSFLGIKFSPKSIIGEKTAKLEAEEIFKELISDNPSYDALKRWNDLNIAAGKAGRGFSKTDKEFAQAVIDWKNKFQESGELGEFKPAFGIPKTTEEFLLTPDADFDALAKKVTEDSDLGWFTSVGGQETFLSVLDKLKSGINPDGWKDLKQKERTVLDSIADQWKNPEILQASRARIAELRALMEKRLEEGAVLPERTGRRSIFGIKFSPKMDGTGYESHRDLAEDVISGKFGEIFGFGYRSDARQKWLRDVAGIADAADPFEALQLVSQEKASIKGNLPAKEIREMIFEDIEKLGRVKEQLREARGYTEEDAAFSRARQIGQEGETGLVKYSPMPANEMAIRAPAMRDETTGRIYEGVIHAIAQMDAEQRGAKGPFTRGYVTNRKLPNNKLEFLNADEAFDRAEQIGQLPEGQLEMPGGGLESLRFAEVRKFSPSKDRKENEIELTGPDGKKYRAMFDGYQETATGGHLSQITPLEDLPGSKMKGSTTYGPSLEKAGYKLPADLPAPGITEGEAKFSPRPSKEVSELAEAYAKKVGIEYTAPKGYVQYPRETAKKLAKFYDNAIHSPDAPAVKSSYDAFKRETLDQWNELVEAGYVLEPIISVNSPYRKGADVARDVETNKHLAFNLSSESAFGQKGQSENQLMLEPSGIRIGERDLNYNDLFRAVHDFFGHAKQGFSFGPRGEFNAWRGHANLYSPEAQGALAAETIGQTAWTQLKPELLGPAGELLKPGEPGFVRRADRPYAEQKNIIVPEELIAEARGAQFSPRKDADPLKLLGTQHGNASKAWILPSGNVEQLGAQWHHDWLSENPEVAAKYKLDVPAFEGNEVAGVREGALKRGFARVNLSGGTLTVEVREKNWSNVRPIVEDMIEKNLDDVDRVRVGLLNDTATDLQKTFTAKLFDAESDRAKMDRVYESFSEDARNERGAAFSPPKRKAKEEKGYEAGEYWLGGEKLNYANDGHLNWVFDNLSYDKIQKEYADSGASVGELKDAYKFSEDKGYLRTVISEDRIDVEKSQKYPEWRDVPRRLKQEIEDARFSRDLPVYFAGRLVSEAPRGTKFSPPKRKAKEEKVERDNWIDQTGKIIPAPNGHAAAAEGFLPEGWVIKGLREATLTEIYDKMQAGKFLRSTQDENTIYFDGDIENSDSLPRSQRQAIEDLAFKTDKEVMYNGRPMDIGPKSKAKFSPKRGQFEDPETIREALGSPGWAIITGTQEAQGKWNAPANIEANKSLEAELQEKGYEYIPIKGTYKGVPQGADFLVTDISTYDAQAFGKKYKQESVLTPKGLLYGDGTITPGAPENTMLGAEARKQEFFSTLPNGLSFSVPLDFSKAPFQPVGEQSTLFGGREYESPANFTQAELRQRYPEAIVPKNSKEQIGSDIVGSPLYKESANPVQAFADKIVEFVNQYKDNPVYQLGLKWYSDFVPLLKKEFGADAPMMAQLLAASSPNEKPKMNFFYATDALEGFKSGRFGKIISKFNEGFDLYKSDKWLSWYNKELKAGNIVNPPAEPTPERFLAHWIYKHNLKPKQSNGQLYGFHGRAILEVMAGKWLQENKGPKVGNFVQNLLGTGFEATIDVWADRTMRRLGYADTKNRWRIMPANVEGVSDADFAFSQKAFRAAADKLGIEASAIQGGLWFAEKQLWAENGWGKLDLGSYVDEMANLPLIRQAIKQRLTKTAQSAKIKPMETGELKFSPRQRKLTIADLQAAHAAGKTIQTRVGPAAVAFDEWTDVESPNFEGSLPSVFRIKPEADGDELDVQPRPTRDY